MMKVALAQINPTLGDFSGNAAKILEYCIKASQKQCDLIIFPECSLFGYHPMDLLERDGIVKTQLKELDSLKKRIPKGLGVIVSGVTHNTHKKGKPYLNAAIFLQKNKKPQIFAKELLPTYDVFDEARHIEPGDLTKNFLKFKKQRILITICEDIWAWPNVGMRKGRANYKTNPILKVPKSKVDFVVNISASPYTTEKKEARLKVCTQVVNHFKKPMIYLNMVGAQDELIYDGSSMVFNKKAERILQMKSFEEQMEIIDFNKDQKKIATPKTQTMSDIRAALVLGLRDFISKTGFQNVHLGLSGGLDSAVVACLAVEAFSSKNVAALAMPTEFNIPESLIWSQRLAKKLGIKLIEYPIQDLYKTMDQSLQNHLGETPFGLVQENLQARIRATILMAYSNKNHSILLNTSNKSEMAMGYSTLYGDLAGGLSPIGDLLKTQVFQLAECYKEIIPKEILERPPSAELRPNQKDEDSLPPYDKLDQMIDEIVLHYKPAVSEKEKSFLNALMKSEFKRWQAPPILKVSNHAFGRGRRFPIAHKSIF